MEGWGWGEKQNLIRWMPGSHAASSDAAQRAGPAEGLGGCPARTPPEAAVGGGQIGQIWSLHQYVHLQP